MTPYHFLVILSRAIIMPTISNIAIALLSIHALKNKSIKKNRTYLFSTDIQAMHNITQN